MGFDLENQRVVVTGAARGIGLAIAGRFHELGAKICGWDIEVAPIAHDGGFDTVIRVDVSDENAVAHALEATLDRFGHVDVLIANAGVNGPTKPSWEYTLDEWRQVLEVDLTGVFLSTRALVPHMRARDYGRIVIISSVTGKEGNPGACAYGAAKAGVIGYAKGLARELLPGNITVNTVAPAITETDLLGQMSDAYIADKKSRIPMNRFCSVGEIADMAAWVASPRCSFTTGQTFDVSGGRATIEPAVTDRIQSERYCVHQVTLMQQCDFREAVEALARVGIGKTAVWRDKLDAVGDKTGRLILDDCGVTAVALCAGGLFCYRDERAYRTAIDANRRWIDQAAAVAAPSLVMITGGLEDFGQDLAGARRRAIEAMGELADYAAAVGVTLVLEPLHPMVCGLRSIVSTLREANDCLDQLERDDVCALALDSYASWWDHELEAQIRRAGTRIRHFHVSDWLADTRDVRLDRGMPGDGLIDNRRIRRWLEASGYDAAVEVEIFSARNWWRQPAERVLATILERYQSAL